MRNTVRAVLTWFLVGGAGAIAVAVLGEWFIHVAEDKGWYANAGRTWDRLMSAIIDFATSSPVIYSMTALGGLVAGVWLDTLLTRREQRSTRARSMRRVEPQLPSITPEMLPKRSPALPAMDTTGFDYPFPKAVLQVSVASPKGTLEAGPNGIPHKLSIIIQVENVHRNPIKEWHAKITRVSSDGDRLPIEGELAISRSHREIGVGKRANVLFLYRDVSDAVSCPPFLLRMLEKDVPLKENREYLIGMELRCGNPYVTDLLLALRTGKDLDAEVTIIHQSVGHRWLPDTATETQP